VDEVKLQVFLEEQEEALGRVWYFHCC